MSTITQFVILGLSTGSLYVLGALGLVLVKRSSGVINFAHAAIGMVATYVFWELRDRNGVPFVIALIVGLLVAALLGAMTYQFVMRPLRKQSLLAQLVGTLAVLAILQALTALRYPEESAVVAPILPTQSVSFFGVSIGLDRLLVLVGVVVLVVILAGYYRYSTFGRTTTAVADNSDAAAGLGISPDKISLINWTVGAALAGLAGIFLSPILGLDIQTATLLIVPMLAAAVVGDFKSFPLTLAGGLIIGVTQSLLVNYTSTPGLVSVVPALLAAAVLISKGRATPARGDSAIRMPSIGSGRIRPLPLAAVTAALVTLIWVVPIKWVDALTLQAAVAVVLLSLVVVVGYCGQLSLAQFAFAGLGGWISGTLATNLGWPLILAIFAAVATSVLMGIVLAVVGARTRGLNLAIITLAFAAAADAVIFSNTSLQGGIGGISTPNLSIFGWKFDYLLYPQRFATVAVLVMIIALVAVANMRRSRVGRRLIAVRTNERAASSLGISVLGSKVFAFSTGAALAAIGGVLLSYMQFNLTFTNGQYGLMSSITLLMEGVVGGVGWVSGAPVGSLLHPGSVGTLFLGTFGESAEKYIFLIGGILLLVTILQGPDGIVPNTLRQLKQLGARRTRRQGPTGSKTALADLSVRDVDVVDKVQPKLLVLDDLTVRYGGVVAVDGLSLEIRPGKVTGLIGPNGAGKTSVLDAITGFSAIASGTAELDGQQLAALTPHARARLGLGRSFQSLELFSDMTVLENLLAASEPRGWKGNLTSFVWSGQSRLTKAGLAAIREFKLDDVLDKRPGELPHGRQRMLAIARAVAAEPSVLLLDEPAAGLDEVESAELTHLIRRLARDWGMAVLVIEHDIPLVLAASDYIYTIEFGGLIAEGTPEEIRDHPEVRRAYLGTEEEGTIHSA